MSLHSTPGNESGQNPAVQVQLGGSLPSLYGQPIRRTSDPGRALVGMTILNKSEHRTAGDKVTIYSHTAGYGQQCPGHGNLCAKQGHALEGQISMNMMAPGAAVCRRGRNQAMNLKPFHANSLEKSVNLKRFRRMPPGHAGGEVPKNCFVPVSSSTLE